MVSGCLNCEFEVGRLVKRSRSGGRVWARHKPKGRTMRFEPALEPDSDVNAHAKQTQEPSGTLQNHSNYRTPSVSF